MSRPFIVGLTGGMGAGKSTVIDFMVRDPVMPLGGSAVFDCDAIVHQLYNEPGIIQLLVERYGAIEGPARAFCAELVQKDPSVIDELESIFIPAVKARLEDRIGVSPYRIMIVDAPLLFETGLDKRCNRVVVIHCPEEIRRQRIMTRPGMTEAKMNLLLARQISDADRLTRADIKISTDGNIASTRLQTEEALRTLRSLADAHGA